MGAGRCQEWTYLGYFSIRIGSRESCWHSWGAVPLAGGTPDGGQGAIGVVEVEMPVPTP